jgi:hypothetical protein
MGREDIIIPEVINNPFPAFDKNSEFNCVVQ